MIAPVVAGYSLSRLLSQRERSKVYLAQDTGGKWCAVKLYQPPHPTDLPELLRRNDKLQPLTRAPGLVEMFAHGATPDGWIWKALKLADPIRGLPELDTPLGVQQYTALTMLGWTLQVETAPTALLVTQWGLRIASALQVLHSAGLVHRDVKPANILFIGGEPCLGDYGLAGEPGGKVDYRGTEGFQPFEGTDDQSADLYALGKTLYEVWTGENRLEFPSLPRRILDSPEWKSAGYALNEVILKACHQHARKRFRTAKELSTELENVTRGWLNRRRWLAVTCGGAAGALGAAFVLALNKAPIKLRWRQIQTKGFNVESWRGHTWTVDWARGYIHSFWAETKGNVYEQVQLENYSLDIALLQGDPIHDPSCVFHSAFGELSVIEGGLGEVHALNPETRQLRQLGGGEPDARHFGACTYWNPLTQRIGTFSGYGYFANRNDRHEFDASSGVWIELDKNEATHGRPWRRTVAIPFVPDQAGEKLYLVGGYGSLTGKQGEQMPEVRGFDGRFHYLDDVWELDLRTGQWKCLLPNGRLDPRVLRAAAFFPESEALVVFEGMKVDDPKAQFARAFLIDPSGNEPPVALHCSGEISRMAQAWFYAVNPDRGTFLLFADDGIFEVSSAKA